jgi:hypothetical protein
MKTYLFLIIITVNINLFGQTKDSLTLYNFKQTILPDNNSSYILTKIVTSSVSKDTFYLKIQTFDTYCNSFKPEFSTIGDTLFLGVSIGESSCLATYANYHFDFKFSNPGRKYIIKWNGEEVGYSEKIYKQESE